MNDKELAVDEIGNVLEKGENLDQLIEQTNDLNSNTKLVIDQSKRMKKWHCIIL